MKTRIQSTLVQMLCVGGLFLSTAHAQEATVVRNLVETVLRRGGSEATDDLVSLGGQKAASAVLEKATQEGGEELAGRIAKQTSEYGFAVLQGAKVSPARFADAFDALPSEFKAGAMQAVRREPDLMANLVATYGRDGLEIAARQPGIGPRVLSEIGEEGSLALKTLPTDDVIRLSKLSPEIGKLPSGQRSELMSLIQQAPTKVFNLLEGHPNILMTGAALTAFLASKDLILGKDETIIGPDGKVMVVGKQGFISRLVTQLATPIDFIASALVLGILGWFGVKIWHNWHRAKSQIESRTS